MLDYETLRFIWWLLLGVLLVGFALTDGFDLGVAALLRVLGHDDGERRAVLEAIEPMWEGNQVWFILAGGAVFAAWPLLYAASFSGFYFAMLAVLLALILRPVGFTFRGKIEQHRWRDNWDWVLTFSGALPALLFGVAFGNLFIGLGFDIDNLGRFQFNSSFWDLLNPFALLCGVMSLCMLLMHGAAYAAVKVSEPVQSRAKIAGSIAAVGLVACLVLCGWYLNYLPGHVVAPGIDHAAASNPAAKAVNLVEGAWLNGYQAHPLLQLIPLTAVLAAMATALLLYMGALITGLLMSSLSVTAVIFTGGVSLFPFLLPSSHNPNVGLTVWDASSSQHTLALMVIATCIFLPMILAYTSWAYGVMRGQINVESVRKHLGLY